MPRNSTPVTDSAARSTNPNQKRPSGSKNAPLKKSNASRSSTAGSQNLASNGVNAQSGSIADIRHRLDEYENQVSDLRKNKDGRLERVWPAGTGETTEYNNEDIIRALNNAKKGEPGGDGCALADCAKKTGGQWAPAVLTALKTGLKEMQSTCVSGARSRADQVRIKTQNPEDGAAAVPGYSRHETCDALDITGKVCPEGLIKLINETHSDDNPVSHCSTTGG